MKLVQCIVCMFLLCAFSTEAQKARAEIIFNDGTKRVGLAKITYDDRDLMFRKAKKEKKEFISFKNVDTLKMYYHEDPTLYAKAKIKGVDEPVLMYVGIYKRMVAYKDFGSANIPITVSVGSVGGSRSYSVASYYFRKLGDKEASYIGTDQTSFRKLETAMTPFFKDCLVLMEKIKARDYNRKKIWQLVKFYDNQCKTTN